MRRVCHDCTALPPNIGDDAFQNEPVHVLILINPGQASNLHLHDARHGIRLAIDDALGSEPFGIIGTSAPLLSLSDFGVELVALRFDGTDLPCS
ncbi:hypothetical protein BH10PSE7_BH10PSE7_17910 [soil metagenome]